MKKILLSAIATVVLSSGIAQAANTGTISFNGELTANTCDVSVDGKGADATVILPTVSIQQLASATRTAGDTGFVMALTNCAGPTLNTASAFFQAGASVDAVTGRLLNMTTGGAEHVSLQLLDGSSVGSAAVIKVGSQAQVADTIYQDVSGGSATLPYIVRYYAEAPTSAGIVTSNVVYSIQYQ
ncbi:fimbrial protein [Serratia fonticola]|uniref:fimbrial protein n=1 Tax=Serratia fonticola TaxID=47917 RepID=UPI00192D05BD|nr:fimbrial protein [Serratia fonticola]MBL5829854.1 type 1 fimbrial protein [Serratia fonticola]